MNKHPILCQSCGIRLSVEQVSESERDALADQHSHAQSVDELPMLLKVQQFYARHPEAREKIKPHFTRVLESDDPLVVEQLFDRAAFDDILLPEDEWQPASEIISADQEAIDYLRQHYFDLEARLQVVRSSVAQPVNEVACPICHEGMLTVPDEDWWSFSSWGESVYHRIHWQCDAEDGSLQVPLSAYQRDGSHWSGAKPVAPDDPDFAFWMWLIEQPEHQRSIETQELNAIKENWLRETTDS